MKNVLKRAFYAVALAVSMAIGAFVGYRATILNAQIYFVDAGTMAIEVWGQTDLYYIEGVG